MNEILFLVLISLVLLAFILTIYFSGKKKK